MGRTIINGSSGKMILNGRVYGNAQNDEITKITNYTKIISATLIHCVILKVNHRIICHIYWEEAGLSANTWNPIVRLNAEDVADVTEWSYGTDSFSGYYSTSATGVRYTARYNPETREIQIYNSVSTKTNLFIGLKDVPIYNFKRIAPVITDSSVCESIAGGESIKLGNYLICDFDVFMGSGSSAGEWKFAVLNLCEGYSITDRYGGGSRMEAPSGYYHRDYDVWHADNGVVNIYPYTNRGNIWKIRAIFTIEPIQS